MCSCKRVRWQVFSAGGWAIHLVLCLVEDLAGSPQTGEDVLNCVYEAHCGLIQTWGALYTIAACTACTIHGQIRPSTHACMQTRHSHMDACRHATLMETCMDACHSHRHATHACMDACTTRHSHMHACRHATHTCMHADTPLTHACMQTCHSHMHADTSPTHTCMHADTLHADTSPTHACRHITHTCMHADTPLTHACMQTRHSHMHACRHATHTCMQTRHPLTHACRHATHTSALVRKSMSSIFSLRVRLNKPGQSTSNSQYTGNRPASSMLDSHAAWRVGHWLHLDNCPNAVFCSLAPPPSRLLPARQGAPVSPALPGLQ